jgi:hypothetical protein
MKGNTEGFLLGRIISLLLRDAPAAIGAAGAHVLRDLNHLLTCC